MSSASSACTWDVFITRAKRFPNSVYGIAFVTELGTPAIVYCSGLSPRQRNLTIFHELAHHIYDVPRGVGAGRWQRVGERYGLVRDEKCEARADRFAEEMLAMLEARDVYSASR